MVTRKYREKKGKGKKIEHGMEEEERYMSMLAKGIGNHHHYGRTKVGYIRREVITKIRNLKKPSPLHTTFVESLKKQRKKRRSEGLLESREEDSGKVLRSKVC